VVTDVHKLYSDRTSFIVNLRRSSRSHTRAEWDLSYAQMLRERGLTFAANLTSSSRRRWDQILFREAGELDSHLIARRVSAE